ncbi:FliM/FliN family flagellar motor switch protein [Erythrobacter sp. SCSIO 43205]|uniref:FliM/FliN family flagellar motor switch protein n=1 Tax=Erythrobacter sp. SCSIO 43205 TaxID=2779361 RepID=UPI001CA9E7B8|nr:FliM/FliN family flagellar motor switch protein [Erythrobacter sp. SCSIO 43205]UAB78747.1 FliM/FliN family flagellar motor switch protein [Erythrobacter sp. SCSIO 43205]
MNAFTPGLSPALQRLGEVSVRLSVELGRTNMALRDVLALAEGSVVSLDRLTDELLEITANGQVIAYGEVIAQDGKFALRIVSLANGDAPAPSPPPPRPQPSAPPRPDAPVSGAAMPGAPATPEAQAQPTPEPAPEPAVGEQAAEAPPQEAAEASADAADIDELAAALDETLGDAAPDTDAPVEEAASDPLADALADLPEPPAEAQGEDTPPNEAGE